MYPVLAPLRLTQGLKFTALFLVSGMSLLAQLPGTQYPGQLPPGQYPGQYPPNQYPGQNPQGRSSGNSNPSSGRSRKTSSSDTKPSQSYSGAIRRVDDKSLDVEATDTRILTFQISDSTTKPSGDLKPGDGVDIVATQDKDGTFQAVSIKSNPEMARKVETNDQLEPEERTGPPPTILVRPGQDDNGDAPKLKRGIPDRVSAARTDDDRPVPPIQRAPPPPANPREAFIEKARTVAGSFLENLPNYVCQEITTRYYSETRVPSWNVIDVLTADVVYEGGRESYRNLMINGKPLKKPPEESGSWSTGEFGTILAELFAPGSAAKFRYAQEDSIAHRPATVYDYSVERMRSSWKIQVPGQYIMPAYKGSVWLDKESAHALRIEMQAKEIPEEFPRISVETAVDYDYITLGTPDKYLLPIRAEVLSCDRGSNQCDRNVIEFRNYHKFTGESTIKFNQ
jgi:hypothetical protein